MIAKTKVDMKKICYVIGTLEIGGTERQLLRLCRDIDKNRFLPVVISLRCGGHLKEDFEKYGIRVIEVGKKYKIDFLFFLRLIHILHKEKPDILQTFMFTSNTWGRIAGLLCRVPVIIACERSTDKWKKNHHFFIDIILGFFTDVIVCNCFTVKKHYERKIRPVAGKLVVIPNGIEIEDIEKPPEFVAQKKEKIVLTAGRLSPEKGIQYFIKGARIVLSKIKNVKFIIVGDGPLRENLERLVYECRIKDNVIFTGYQKDMKDFITMSDVVVLSSLWEGLPNILLEAMALKKPVIATDVGGVREIVKNGENGFIVSPGCPDEIADKIINILSDDEASLKMGENAYRFVKENFDIKKMVSSYEFLYEKLLSRQQHKKG